MRVIETNIYTIGEHPNKNKCFDYIRDNWHDLNQHSVDEVIESIEKLSNLIGGSYDYCIGQVPDRGEFISFRDFSYDALNELSADDCPLTGVYWDIDLIEGLKNENLKGVLASLHNSTEYIYSDEGLNELCEANEFEFEENGSIY